MFLFKYGNNIVESHTTYTYLVLVLSDFVGYNELLKLLQNIWGVTSNVFSKLYKVWCSLFC